MLIIGENIHIIAPPVKAAIEARDAKTIQAMAVAQVEAGAGIVADSVPESEYEETQNKAAALLRAIDLAHEQFGDGGTP